MKTVVGLHPEYVLGNAALFSLSCQLFFLFWIKDILFCFSNTQKSWQWRLGKRLRYTVSFTPASPVYSTFGPRWILGHWFVPCLEQPTQESVLSGSDRTVLSGFTSKGWVSLRTFDRTETYDHCSDHRLLMWKGVPVSSSSSITQGTEKNDIESFISVFWGIHIK